jgi:hypothetical protein
VSVFFWAAGGAWVGWFAAAVGAVVAAGWGVQLANAMPPAANALTFKNSRRFNFLSTISLSPISLRVVE